VPKKPLSSYVAQAEDSIEDALAFAARCGAEQLTRPGPYA